MQSAAAGWLMTALDPSPFTVSLVQVAASLPMFLFAIPAGALADIVDRRRLMIFIQMAVTVFGFAFAILVRVGQVTPDFLLAFMFLAAAAAALIMPVWQSIVPQLVSPQLLQPAIALNSAGVNVSRAIGPALAGIVIAAWGMDAPFWLNALSNIAVIAALLWWRPLDAKVVHNLPSERFLLAIGAGLRYARYNPHLRATQIRALGFYVFASAYWALLPLVARDQIAGGPTFYGILLSAIGVGAVGGLLPSPSSNAVLVLTGLSRRESWEQQSRFCCSHLHGIRRGNRSKRTRGHVMDRRVGDTKYLSSSRSSQLGPRSRSFDLQYSHVWIAHARKCHLG